MNRLVCAVDPGWDDGAVALVRAPREVVGWWWWHRLERKSGDVWRFESAAFAGQHTEKESLAVVGRFIWSRVDSLTFGVYDLVVEGLFEKHSLERLSWAAGLVASPFLLGVEPDRPRWVDWAPVALGVNSKGLAKGKARGGREGFFGPGKRPKPQPNTSKAAAYAHAVKAFHASLTGVPIPDPAEVPHVLDACGMAVWKLTQRRG